jgi:urease accessory protein
MVTNYLALPRLLQLCSANLPIGGFAFSQGLETAIDLGWISTKKDLYNWVATILHESITKTDLALLHRQWQALYDNDLNSFDDNEHLVFATRETSELLAAECAMGSALIRLITNLKVKDHTFDRLSLPFYIEHYPKLSFVSSFAIASHLFELDMEMTLYGFTWTFIDNQVAAGLKLIPLGQTDGQNLLFSLSNHIPECVSITLRQQTNSIGQSMAGLAIASSLHEQQYSRLFRS